MTHETSISVGLEASVARVVDALVTRVGGEPLLLVLLRDGRAVGLRLWLYPTLLLASPATRWRWELIAGGRGVRWPGLDLDLSVSEMLAGTPDVTRAAKKSVKALDLRGFARAFAQHRTMRRAG